MEAIYDEKGEMVQLRDLWVCEDCLMAIANGDFTGLDYHYKPKEAAARQRAIEAGLEREAPMTWVADSPREIEETSLTYNEELDECVEETKIVMEGEDATTMSFSRDECDCCETSMAGTRHRACLVKIGIKEG